MKSIQSGIKEILNGYKGVEVREVMAWPGYGGGLWAFIKTNGITERQMKLASRKIFKQYETVTATHFEGGWFNYIYTRESLKRAD